MNRTTSSVFDAQIQYYDSAQRESRRLASAWIVGTLAAYWALSSTGSNQDKTYAWVILLLSLLSASGLYLLQRVSMGLYQPLIRSTLCSARLEEMARGKGADAPGYLVRDVLSKGAPSSEIKYFFIAPAVILILIGCIHLILSVKGVIPIVVVSLIIFALGVLGYSQHKAPRETYQAKHRSLTKLEQSLRLQLFGRYPASFIPEATQLPAPPQFTVVLSGGTHSGKTAIANELHKRGATVVSEAGLAVISDLTVCLGGAKRVKEYKDNNPNGFQKRISTTQIRQEQAVLGSSDFPGLVVFDRSMVDGLAYCKPYGKVWGRESGRGNAKCPVRLKTELEMSVESRYHLAFVLDTVTPFDERGGSGRQTEEKESKMQGKLLYSLYKDCGMMLHRYDPPTGRTERKPMAEKVYRVSQMGSLEERVDFIWNEIIRNALAWKPERVSAES